MSQKSKRLAEVLALVPAQDALPPVPEGRKLLDTGFLFVLTRRLSPTAAEKTLVALSQAYPDWNELRVSQVQEFRHLIQTRSDDLALQVARDVREFLQEIYQKVHGFDLEALRGDLAEAARFASQLTFIGAAAGHLMLHLACPDELPISPAIVRTLDRLGLAKRTTSLKKAQAAVDPMVPAAERADFALRMGRVIESWCDGKKPLCWECPLVVVCPYGKKVERDWKASQKRLEMQRQRDEERALKEAEKERKRAAAEEKRRLIAKAKDDARKLRLAERERSRIAREAKARAVQARAKAAKARSAKARKAKTTKKTRKTTRKVTSRGKKSAVRARPTGRTSKTARKTTSRGKKATTSGTRKKTAPKKVVHKRATQATSGKAKPGQAKTTKKTARKTARKTTRKTTRKTKRGR